MPDLQPPLSMWKSKAEGVVNTLLHLADSGQVNSLSGLCFGEALC